MRVSIPTVVLGADGIASFAPVIERQSQLRGFSMSFLCLCMNTYTPENTESKYIVQSLSRKPRQMSITHEMSIIDCG